MARHAQRMAHGDFDIDLDVVWETVREWSPQLLRQPSALRPDADDRGDDDRT